MSILIEEDVNGGGGRGFTARDDPLLALRRREPLVLRDGSLAADRERIRDKSSENVPHEKSVIFMTS